MKNEAFSPLLEFLISKGERDIRRARTRGLARRAPNFLFSFSLTAGHSN